MELSDEVTAIDDIDRWVQEIAGPTHPVIDEWTRVKTMLQGLVRTQSVPPRVMP